MFESLAAAEPAVTVSTRSVSGWVGALAGLDRTVGDAERIDQLRALEELKAAAAAAQARVAADLHASVRDRHAAAGLPAAECGLGVA
ncbi:MAG: HNH endonuclease, partial [Actinomycetes bacterium]